MIASHNTVYSLSTVLMPRIFKLRLMALAVTVQSDARDFLSSMVSACQNDRKAKVKKRCFVTNRSCS